MKKFLILTLAILSLYSCRDTTTIGTDLFDDDIIDVQSVTYNDLNINTVVGDSTLTMESQSNFLYYLLGEVHDEVFGTYGADLYVAMNKISSYQYPNATVDSVVMTMLYDTLGFQGDTTQQFDISIYQLEEPYREIEAIYSNAEFISSMVALSETSTSVAPRTEVEVFQYQVDSTVTLSPHLRMPLPLSFGEKLLADSLLTAEEFAEAYPGFKISAKTDGVGGIMSFALSDAINQGLTFNTVEVYLTDEEGEPGVIKFPFSSKTYNHFFHDYTGSEISNYLGQDPESLLFAQAMAGPSIKVDISETVDLTSDQIINHAQLTLFEAEGIDKDSTSLFPKNDFFYAYQLNEDNVKTLITDVAKANSSRRNQYLDGELKDREINNSSVSTAIFNITDFVKEYIESENDGIFYIIPINPTYNGKRSVFYGNGNDSFDPTLKITYTNN